MTLRRCSKISFLSAIVLVALFLIYNYAMFTNSIYNNRSFCVSKFYISEESEKINNAIKYLNDVERKFPHLKKGDVNERNCCSVGKGGVDTRPLGFQEYLMHDWAYYVEIKRTVVIDSKSHPSKTMILENSCGKPLYYGEKI